MNPDTVPSPRKAKHHKAKARAHGEGSVCLERSTGKWLAVVDLGIVEGKRKRKKLRFDTQAEARQALTKLRKALDDGIAPGDDRMTVGRFLERWLAECVEGPLSSLSAATRSSYALCVRLHVAPSLGHHTLAKLSPLHVQGFLSSKMSGGTLSSRTVQYLHSVLRTALGQAERWGLVTRNVCRLVTPPTPATRDAVSLTGDDRAKARRNDRAQRDRAAACSVDVGVCPA